MNDYKTFTLVYNGMRLHQHFLELSQLRIDEAVLMLVSTTTSGKIFMEFHYVFYQWNLVLGIPSWIPYQHLIKINTPYHMSTMKMVTTNREDDWPYLITYIIRATISSTSKIILLYQWEKNRRTNGSLLIGMENPKTSLGYYRTTEKDKGGRLQVLTQSTRSLTQQKMERNSMPW